MAFRYHKFDDVLLPANDPEPDLSAGPVEASILDSAGGAYDYYGSRQRLPRKQNISLQGIYIGETDFLVDHLDNFLTDHSGNFLITGDGPRNLRSQITTLTAKLGVRGQFWRERLDDSTILQWKTARLLNVAHKRTTEDVDVKSTITVLFETRMAAWRSANASSKSGTLPAGVAFPLYPEVGGNVAIEDAIITLTATSTITSLVVASTALGVGWSWAGSLGAGNSLVLDCGLQTILNNGVDAYSGFSYGVAHSAAGWLPMATGMNQIWATADAAGTFTISWYDQWL